MAARWRSGNTNFPTEVFVDPLKNAVETLKQPDPTVRASALNQLSIAIAAFEVMEIEYEAENLKFPPKWKTAKSYLISFYRSLSCGCDPNKHDYEYYLESVS